jgi:2-iminobutanoate/2-iminopropanoate deaminase
MSNSIPSAERVDSNTESATEIARPSTASKKQREGSDHVGAFGARTGKSDLLFLEGILPEDDEGVRCDLPLDEQVRICFDRLREVLSSRGADLSSVMKIELQVTDLSRRATVDDAYRKQFEDNFPPRTTIEVRALPGGAGVQLDVIAADR